MTELSLGQAAKTANKSKSTINRAIKAGKLSAQRKEDGSYRIDPAELFRVWPAPLAEPSQTDPQTDPRGTPELLQMKIEMLEAQLVREQEAVEDLRGRLDRAEDRMALLTYTGPQEGLVAILLRRLRGR